MFSDELEDPSVSLSVDIQHVMIVTNAVSSFAAMLYTPEGQALIVKVWAETMAELDFAGPKAILESMRI